jgi:methyl-accepting chemotaxis protein
MLKDIAEGEGDLTKRLKVDRKDELGEVSHWFNLFVDNVHGIVLQLADNTGKVSASCMQLNATAEQIATAAEEVACQSGTVATASEEMSCTSNDISRNCGQAAASSRSASDTALGGAEVVQQTLLGMQNIAERVKESARTVESLGARSDQIGEIVGTIEDIADQTNLLALNAAIEAARAGEQGRGFAVVADEVRALAERTTRATREIGEMIKAIQNETSGAVGSMELGVQEVERGMESSRKSGVALQDILAAINEVTMQIHQIATAAEEQTAVTGEISSNIHMINDVVLETAKGAHETADAAGHLSSLAHELQQIVGRFKLA